MKMKSKIIKILPFILVVGLASCQMWEDDINVDPNNPTSTEYQSVLTTAGVGQILVQNGINSRMAGIFAGTHTGIDRQYQGYNSYSVTTSDFDGLWDDIFVNAFRNARLSRNLATEQGIQGVTIGIAQVLEALSAGTAAALYGDIPFDQLANVEFTNPAFESQTEVYAKVQLLLDEAITNLGTGTGRPLSNADIFFDGNPEAWTEVAYTLKARFYMHTGEYGLAYAAAQNGVSSADNSMNAPFTSAIEASNLNWQLFELETQGADIIMSDFIVNMLAPTSPTYRGNAKTDETARYNYLFQSTVTGFQLNTSNEGIAGQTTPAAIVSFQENLLILAEAGARSEGFDTGLVHLNEFRAFMNSGGYMTNPNAAEIKYDAYDAADFDNGGIENQDNVSVENALLREILEERYVTLISQIEIFNDVRRTMDEMLVRVPVQPNSGSALPERFLYAQSEIDRNENIPASIPSLFEPTSVNQ